ncbi:Lipase member H [Ooceraea biroi]|uniref:phospholipase A1 n=1 Tax=Ooceraea biroi TaxID=2015173 RepID=A0A026VWE3_OOCBI|nr:Lipase member H [Ooceraea biroi]
MMPICKKKIQYQCGNLAPASAGCHQKSNPGDQQGCYVLSPIGGDSEKNKIREQEILIERIKRPKLEGLTIHSRSWKLFHDKSPLSWSWNELAPLCYEDTDNVVLLDWSKYSMDIFYGLTFETAEGVGSLFAQSLQLLKDNEFNTSTIYIIGHSLGAHIAGLAGKCTNFTIPRITGKCVKLLFIGLDPANRLWYPTGCYLAPTDASWVDVIHTDMGVWGTPASMGTVEYYANTGHRLQPNCPTFSLLPEGIAEVVLCPHELSNVIYAESKYYPDKYVAVSCHSADSFLSGGCKNNTKTGVGYAASNV